MHKIDFFYEIDFSLKGEHRYRAWIGNVIHSEGYNQGAITYIFCDDEYLQNLHKKYLDKDDLTDIITFDYSEGKFISGDIFISIPRLQENAVLYGSGFDEELVRVMSHGILHLMGFKDKQSRDSELMRKKEDDKIRMFHVEQ